MIIFLSTFKPEPYARVHVITQKYVKIVIFSDCHFYNLNPLLKQECIQVGCVPTAHWPYLVVSHHAHPPPCTSPPCTPPAMHACSPATHAPHHAHPLPHMPPCHACPPGQNSWHTLLKILPFPNFVLGGKKDLPRVSQHASRLFRFVSTHASLNAEWTC